MKCPCKDCVDKRKLGCHGFCQEYKDWQKWNDEQREKRLKEKSLRECRSAAYANFVTKFLRRKK